MIGFGERIDDRHLSGLARWSDDVALLPEPEYDLILLGASWDARCVVITECAIVAKLAIVVVPTNRGSGNLRAQHDGSVFEWAKRTAGRVELVEGATEDVGDLYDTVRAHVDALHRELARPLRILVDLSATVRFLTLGIIAAALSDALASVVDILYAEGAYGDIVSFTEAAPKMEGAWEAIAIPGLEGDWYPNGRRHFLVSVGFNADKAARLAERWDPNEISVLFPKPGLRPEYDKATEDANSRWIARFGVPDKNRLEAPPGDVIEAWRRLASSPEILGLSDNVYGLLCGSKTHALAIVLWSLVRRSPAVLYVRPTIHVEQEIAPNGKYWLYRVWDRTIVT